MTPLMYAARDGHQSVARRLVQHGASCDTRNREDGGWTAAHYAAYFDRAPVLHTLIHAGADLRVRTEVRATACLSRPAPPLRAASHLCRPGFPAHRRARRRGTSPNAPVRTWRGRCCGSRRCVGAWPATASARATRRGSTEEAAARHREAGARRVPVRETRRRGDQELRRRASSAGARRTPPTNAFLAAWRSGVMQHPVPWTEGGHGVLPAGGNRAAPSRSRRRVPLPRLARAPLWRSLSVRRSAAGLRGDGEALGPRTKGPCGKQRASSRASTAMLQLDSASNGCCVATATAPQWGVGVTVPESRVTTPRRQGVGPTARCGACKLGRAVGQVQLPTGRDLSLRCSCHASSRRWLCESGASGFPPPESPTPTPPAPGGWRRRRRLSR